MNLETLMTGNTGNVLVTVIALAVIFAFYSANGYITDAIYGKTEVEK